MDFVYHFGNGFSLFADLVIARHNLTMDIAVNINIFYTNTFVAKPARNGFIIRYG